ncbi:CU044_5270 family protein [Actinocorallia sp. A-T 12471]|uniref:CU044_5270 family protein n=1 Tax=Actinocorallia sp. A-T 12471 TaxID=3089813 RepID=UPI0029D18000|nr:CU044_5270 family protein [Actinocorallia sp. A-T 12471]MDX6742678.1 CU044_5270 family protein [Actinocorallia sp. A-T 12471]
MSRDPLRLLKQARPAELDPSAPVAEEIRQAELTAAMASGVPSREKAGAVRAARRGPARLGWGVGLAGVLTAAAVAFSVLPPETPADGRTSPAPSASGQAAPGVVALDAKTVLLAAAQGAAESPKETGDYWERVVVSRSYGRTGASPSAYTVVTSDRQESWIPNVKGGRIWNRQQYLGTRPATPQDEAAWRAQGSPTSIPVYFRKGKGTLAPLEVAPGEVKTESSLPLDGDKVFWLGRNVSMRDLRELPADAAKLRSWLLGFYTGSDTEAEGVPMERDAWLFRVVSGMVTDMPLRPEVRSAAFTVLSGLKGVTSLGEVTDPEGRPAVAVSAIETTDNGVLEHRIYLDRTRGQSLAYEITIKKPAGLNAHFPANSPLSSTTVISTTWTAAHP